MSKHPEYMSYLEAHKIFHRYVDVISSNINSSKLPFLRKNAFENTKEEIICAYKLFFAIAIRYGRTIYSQKEMELWSCVLASISIPWVDDAFADEYIQCKKILNDNSLFGRIKYRSAIPFVKEKLDRLTNEMFEKNNEPAARWFIEGKASYTEAIKGICSQSVQKAKAVCDDDKKGQELRRNANEYCLEVYNLVGLTVREEDVNCFFPLPFLYGLIQDPYFAKKFSQEQKRYIEMNKNG